MGRKFKMMHLITNSKFDYKSAIKLKETYLFSSLINLEKRFNINEIFFLLVDISFIKVIKIYPPDNKAV